mgnify:CR=1 FL=1
MDGGLATFVLDPAFVLSLFVGAFHTCIYIFVRGNLGWHIPGLFVGAVLGALVGQAIGGRMGDLLYIGEYSLLWASLMAWVDIGKSNRLYGGMRFAIIDGRPGDAGQSSAAPYSASATDWSSITSNR